MTMTPLTNNSPVYHDGAKIGTVHESTRTRRWFYKTGATISPSLYLDGEQAADALKTALGVRV